MATQDLATLIPQTRRAIDGPAADSATAPSTTLSDTQVTALIADAVGEVIFFTSGQFPHELLVTHRDSTYGAPDGWEIDPELVGPEATVIVAQAALDHFFHLIRDMKVAETIRDEGAEWSYQLSAQAVVEQVRYLTRVRDDAIAQIEANNPTGVGFVNLSYERERRVLARAEWWAYALGR